jgi:hypothetical protein
VPFNPSIINLFEERLLRKLGVTLLEEINTTFGVNHRLLTREIRMTGRTGVYLHFRLG